MTQHDDRAIRPHPPWFLPRGIRARLFLLMGLVLVPMLFLFARMYKQRYDARFSQAMQTEMEVAHGVSTTFVTHIHGVWRMSRAAGQGIITFARYTDEKATRLLARAMAGYPTVRNLSWTAPDGRIVASSDPGLVGRSLADRPYFRDVIRSKGWTIGTLLLRGSSSSSPTFATAVAIVDDAGEVRGAVVAGFEPTRLGEVILTHARPADGAFAIFDSTGTLVYRHPEINLTWEMRTRWKAEDPVLRKALQTGEDQVGVTDIPLVGRRWMSARVLMEGLGWVAGAGRPVATAMAPMRAHLLQDASLSLILFSLAFVFAYLVSRTISIPLVHLERDASSTDREEIPAGDDPMAPVEVNRLRRTLAETTERLAANTQRLRLALDNLPDVVTIYDRSLRITYVNPVTMVITGSPPSHFIGRFDSELWPDQYTLWRPQLEAALHTGTVQTAQVDFRSDLGMRTLLITCVPLLDSTGSVEEVMGITHDLTNWKQAEQELRSTLDELTRSNRELEQFAYVASHDLQEPLRMVASYVQLLQKRYHGQLAPDADRYIDFAVDGAKRMQSLIEDLLAFSRIARSVEFQQVNMAQVVTEALTNLQSAVNESGAEVTAGELPVVSGDRTQLIILFQNLIGNGIKYRTGGISPRICIDAVRQGSEWLFSVADNGIGIEPEYFERIFLIFQRLHSREEYPGTGIGLATCRKIVERHHGRIWVESHPGKGSIFHFALPVTQGS